MSKHHSHPDIIKRLKRASGHLSKVIEMLEKEDDCLKIAQQLQAVTQAVVNAKTNLITQHIEECMSHLVDKNKKDHLKEFKEITKYL